MQKFLYITDVHYGAKPLSRKDDYNRAILKKLEHALQICKKLKLILLIGGDLFDKSLINIFELILIVDLFKKYSTVEVVVNRGNTSHDGSYEQSPLTLLRNSGLIQTSDFLDYIDYDGCRVIFAPNQSDPEDKDQFLKAGVTNILMTHHLIVKEPTIYDHFLMSEFKSNADIVLLADYHPFQGINKFGDVLFVSPGAIARRKNTKHEIDRPIRAYNINDKGIDEVLLRYDVDVWLEKKVILKPEEEEATLMDVQEMKSELDFVTENMSLESALEVFAQKNNISKDTYEYVKSRLL